MKISYKKLLILFLLILVSILSLIYSVLLFNVVFKNDFETKKSDVIVVLGYNNSKKETNFLDKRLETALELYNEGYAKNIIVSSGVNNKEITPVSVYMKKWLIDKGVPSNLIITENYSVNIYESLIFTKEIGLKNDFNSFIFITNDFDTYKTINLSKKIYENPSSKKAVVDTNFNKISSYLLEPFDIIKYNFISNQSYNTVIKNKEDSPYSLQKTVDTKEKYSEIINKDNTNYYDITVTYDNLKNQFDVVQTVTFKNTSTKPIEVIKLNLYHNRIKNFSTDYMNYLHIENVTYNNKFLSFSDYSNYLDIEIPKLEPNNSITFNIKFRATIPKISYMTGSNENTIWAKDFFPVISEFENGEFIYNDYFIESGYNEISNYKIKFISDRNFDIVLPNISNIEFDGNKKTTIMENTLLRDVSFAVCKNNKITSTTTKNNVKVSLYHEDVTNLTYNLLNTVEQSIKYMEAYIGSYPYDNFNIVEVTLDRPMVVSNGCIIFVDKDYLSNPNVKSEIITNTVSQWFGQMVSTKDYTSDYLTKGLSKEISSYIYNDNINDLEFFNTEYLMLESIHNNLEETDMNSNNFNMENYDSYYFIKYVKSELMHFSLQNIIKDNWQEFLRAYFRNSSFDTTNEDDFIILSKEFTNQNLDDFFEQWLSENLIDIQGGNN